MHGFWMKDITGIRGYGRNLDHLQEGYVPDRLTKGMVMKDKRKGAEVTNYQPMTFTMTRKVLTGSFSEEIYNHLHEKGFLPLEQKECRRQSRSTKEQLLIDEMIIRN